MLKVIEALMATYNGLPTDTAVAMIPELIRPIVMRAVNGRNRDDKSSIHDESVGTFFLFIFISYQGLASNMNVSDEQAEIEKVSIATLQTIYGIHICYLLFNFSLDSIFAMNPPPPALVKNLVQFFPKLVALLSKDAHGVYYNQKEMIAHANPALGFLKFLDDTDTANMIKTITGTIYCVYFRLL